MKNYLNIIMVLCIITISAQQTPGDIQTEAFTILGATAHIGNGQVIDNSVIIVENGKITACADATTTKMPYKGTIINVEGQHVYPGFIAASSRLGLVEVDAVRATNDQAEIGGMIPHIRSQIAYNAESKVIESMRPNGVLVAQVAPRGGRISGTSSIMQLDAWNWEDATLKADDGIHVNWPNSFTQGRWWLGEDPGYRPNKNYGEQVNELETFIKESQAYLKGDLKVTNLPFEAMKGLYDGTKKLYVHVDDEKGITDAVNFASNNGISKMVIVGGYQAYAVTDLLKKNNVAVLIGHTHSLPALDDHDYDLPFKNPKLLMDAGVLVGIQTGGASNFQSRNLPFYAGQVVGQGMDKEDALKLITSNVAQILGVGRQLGTLETGKDATLFISKGDALDMIGNNVTHAFINGRAISLETHQTKLWKRYDKKINGN